jgi:hypothetical protein
MAESEQCRQYRTADIRGIEHGCYRRPVNTVRRVLIAAITVFVLLVAGAYIFEVSVSAPILAAVAFLVATAFVVWAVWAIAAMAKADRTP